MQGPYARLVSLQMGVAGSTRVARSIVLFEDGSVKNGEFRTGWFRLLLVLKLGVVVGRTWESSARSGEVTLLSHHTPTLVIERCCSNASGGAGTEI